MINCSHNHRSRAFSGKSNRAVFWCVRKGAFIPYFASMSYHEELRCLGKDHQQVVTVSIWDDDRPFVCLEFWNKESDLDPVGFAELGPESARGLASFLKYAAEIIEA